MRRALIIAGIVAISLFANAQKTMTHPEPAPSTPLRQPLPRGQALPLAKQYATDFLQGRGAALWEKMTPTMQSFLGDRAKYEQTIEGINKQLGRVADTLQERMMPALDTQIYSRLIRTENFSGHIVVTVALDPDGKIAALGARPLPNAAATEFGDYKDKTQLMFPLRAEWTVYQGGRSVYDNYHAEFRDQRFAYDVTILNETGSMYRDDGSQLKMFYAYEQPVFAAAAGTVIYAHDAYDDNPVNKPIKSSPAQGNSIIIDHGNGEFSFYAHLRRGSLRVKSGDTVRAGQQIGEVGNSGNSPLPHLHFHLQNTPTWFQGDGLPVSFHNVVVNGVRMSEASPVRGDTIQAQQ